MLQDTIMFMIVELAGHLTITEPSLILTPHHVALEARAVIKL